jgi:hypothetical protein
MRILVCGGRDFKDRQRLFVVLDQVHSKRGIDIIISGAARGADTLAVDWAKSREIAYQEFPADWDQYGKAAGPIRNRQMLVEGKPDGVIAFPGGNGTADMIRQSKKAGLKVYEPL